MTINEQLDRLYKIQEEIRIVQSSGLWEPLHESKLRIIKLIQDLENKRNDTSEINKLKNDIAACDKLLNKFNF